MRGEPGRVPPCVIYSPHFSIGFPGLRLLHPFDNYRAQRAYTMLAKELGLPSESQLRQSPGIGAMTPKLELKIPPGPVTDQDLSIIHSREYLQTLNRSLVVARAVEVLPFALAPRAFLRWALLTPMRWAVAGTLLAAREALRTGLAFSLSGGFHHAKPNHGEGFCLFNDIGYAIHCLRAEVGLKTILYVDLDAHQGNGVCAVFADDPSVKLFDVYNGDIFPYYEDEARARLDVSRPIESGTQDGPYLELLGRDLPEFFRANSDAELVIYNAGSDLVRGDSLGDLALSPEGILQRDLLVLHQARQRNMPLVFLPGGGYTKNSYLMIARSILAVL